MSLDRFSQLRAFLDFNPHDVISLGPRRWLAWKLEQLSATVLDTATWSVLRVKHPNGGIIAEWHVEGNAYGAGISSQFCHIRQWSDLGYTVDWLDFDTFEDYMAWFDEADEELRKNGVPAPEIDDSVLGSATVADYVDDSEYPIWESIEMEQQTGKTSN